MKRTAWVAALAIGAGTLVSACGDDGGGASRDEVVDELVSEGATEEQANCFVDEVGADTAMAISAAEEENDLSEEQISEAVEAMTTCMGGAPGE